MAKTTWDRFDDGYYQPMRNLVPDGGGIDSGALTHEARRREQALVVAFLRRLIVEETSHNHDSILLGRLIERIEKGEHYRASTTNTPFDPANIVTL